MGQELASVQAWLFEFFYNAPIALYVGVAPYARLGRSPWYDTTDIVVPRKSCRLLLTFSYPLFFLVVSIQLFVSQTHNQTQFLPGKARRLRSSGGLQG